MTRYLVQPRDRIFVKAFGFLSFVRNIGKSISKNVSHKYSQKLFDHAKQFVTYALYHNLDGVVILSSRPVTFALITQKR